MKAAYPANPRQFSVVIRLWPKTYHLRSGKTRPCELGRGVSVIIEITRVLPHKAVNGLALRKHRYVGVGVAVVRKLREWAHESRLIYRSNSNVIVVQGCSAALIH